MQYYKSKSKGGGVICITLSNDLDPDRANDFVWPDQGLNCLTF